MTPGTSDDDLLAPRAAAQVFLAFALGYFLSALVRGVTATLAPVFSVELQLRAADLGLLAGAYFVGFAAMQLPLGRALDRHGARPVLLAFMVMAIVGCVAFATAGSLWGLIGGRALVGVGVAASLMAPMTLFRTRFGPMAQMRANSWMLMTGSLGMVASTLPVQWLLPLVGWRGLFWGLAVMFAMAAAAIAWWVPGPDPRAASGSVAVASPEGYRQVFTHPAFVRLAPIAFFHYGALVAVQSLWAGPWLNRVCGHTAEQAARGLFAINVTMLLAFMGWGAAMPRLAARGWSADVLVRRGGPVSVAVLAVVTALREPATAPAWALFCVSCTLVSLTQPALAQAFPPQLAGRALTAYNLVIFLGVFCLQWGIGLVIDALRAHGVPEVQAFQGAFGLLVMCCVAAYLWFLRRGPHATGGLTSR